VGSGEEIFSFPGDDIVIRVGYYNRKDAKDEEKYESGMAG
jgi:hypothetical protein